VFDNCNFVLGLPKFGRLSGWRRIRSPPCWSGFFGGQSGGWIIDGWCLLLLTSLSLRWLDWEWTRATPHSQPHDEVLGISSWQGTNLHVAWLQGRSLFLASRVVLGYQGICSTRLGTEAAELEDPPNIIEVEGYGRRRSGRLSRQMVWQRYLLGADVSEGVLVVGERCCAHVEHVQARVGVECFFCHVCLGFINYKVHRF